MRNLNNREIGFYSSNLEDLGFTPDEAKAYFYKYRTHSSKYHRAFAENWLRANRYAGTEAVGRHGRVSIDNEFQNLDEGLTDMNINHTIAALQDFNTVAVSFGDGGGRTYTFKTNEDFEVGDLAVVLTPDDHYKVVSIVEVHETPEIHFGSNIEYKWIVDKVDISKYENIMEQEKTIAVELRKSIARKKREEVRKDLIESLGTLDVDRIKTLLGNASS